LEPWSRYEWEIERNLGDCPQQLFGAHVIVKMMPIIKLKSTGDEAVSRIMDVLHNSSLRVMTSFDSQLTRTTATPSTCPHHGTADCDCQIVVLLVYDKDGQPATLLAHGQDGETWISLVVAPGQRPHAHLERKIKQALSPLPELEAGTPN
jgi:hypothetical protein